MFRTFANGELLTAQKVNDYLMRQAVIVVANSTERDALPTPNDGMVVYLESDDSLQLRRDGAWVRILTTLDTVADSGWITPTLAAGWAGPGGTVTTLQIRKIANRVTWRGAATGAGAADPLFTLDADYCPGVATGKEQYFSVPTGTGTPPTMARIVIRKNGTVNVQAGSPNFDSISYLVD